MTNTDYVPVLDRRMDQDRRRHNLETLVYCGLARRGRRRDRRRAGDSYYLDWYDPRLVFQGVGIMVLSILDAVFTLILIANGATEINALMARLMDISVQAFVVGKVGITAAGVLFLLMHAHFHILSFTTGRRIIHLLLGLYLLLILYELGLFVGYVL